jgi:hypothetical protein
MPDFSEHRSGWPVSGGCLRTRHNKAQRFGALPAKKVVNLRALQVTATLNPGVPLQRHRFERVTDTAH